MRQTNFSIHSVFHLRPGISILCMFLLSSLFYSIDVRAQEHNSIKKLNDKYEQVYNDKDKKIFFYTIESMDFPSDTVAICTVSTKSVYDSDKEPEVVYHLLKHRWLYKNGDWHMENQEEIISTPGEIIPSPVEPESEKVKELIESLAKSSLAEKENIWQNLVGEVPFVEPIDEEYSLVSFIWRESDDDVKISLFGNLPFHPNGLDYSLVKVPETDLWYQSLRVPSDTRTSYGFDIIRTYKDKKTQKVRSFIVSVADHRNANFFGDVSFIELSKAPGQPFIKELPHIAKGKLDSEVISSQILNGQRQITIYTPPNYSTSVQYPLVIIFDGAFYGANENSTRVPGPTILDNLIGKNLIEPVICVFIHQKNRNVELAGNEKFTDFLIKEAIPFVKQKYSVTDDATEILAGGSSLGGLAGIYAAFKHPNVVGNAFSQSGAFWLPKDVNDPSGKAYIPSKIWLADELIENPKKDIKVWMEISKLESAAKMLGPNRQIRDIMKVKQYNLLYREVNSGHDYLHWRGSLADVLISFFRKD